MPTPAPLAVVVITKDRPASLAVTLSRLAELPEQPPVVVVDNASRQPARVVVEEHLPAARLVCLPANTGAGARNIGVRLAGTELVAFADDDSWWEPGALARAAEIMSADPAIGLLAARVIVAGVEAGEEDPISAQMAAAPLDGEWRARGVELRAITGFLACAAVVRARAFLSVGGFQAEMVIGGEEQMVAWDLWSCGWKALYAPEMVAVHQPAATEPAAARRRRMARNDLWAAWQRLPLRQAERRTARMMRRAMGDAAVAAGMADAVASARFAFSRRAPARLRLLQPERGPRD